MKPDLAKFAAAVRFRDRAAAAAVEHHQRAGLVPSWTYARATFDAIAEMIREDEREKLAAAGRLLPPDTDTRPEVEYAIRSSLPNGTVWTSEPYYRREMAQSNAEPGDVVVERRILAGPWRPVPSTPTKES